MKLKAKFDELRSYIDKMEAELRTELNLNASSYSTIGISFDPAFVLDKIPENGSIENGFYVSRFDEQCVEVLGQDPISGTVFMYLMSDSSASYETMSYKLFIKFYKPTPMLKDIVL